MSLEGVYVNSRESFHKHMRQIIEGPLSTAVGTAVKWLPNNWNVTDYPGVRSKALDRGTPYAPRHKLRAWIQLDIFTNNKQDNLASKIAGKLLDELGFDLEAKVWECAVPQFDYHRNRSAPEKLQEMDLEWKAGPYNGPDEEENVTHLILEFWLHFN